VDISGRHGVKKSQDECVGRAIGQKKQDFVEAPTDDKVTRRPQRAETGRKVGAAMGLFVSEDRDLL
jgi:hypothetical protein